MDDLEQLPLSKNAKILFNLLQVRIFDLSQTLQITGHKLSINQLKENLQKQHNIFGQVQKIFHQLNLQKLYELIKQVSQNYISIASILIDDKMTAINAKCKNVSMETPENKDKTTSQTKINNNSNEKGSLSKRKTAMNKIKQQQAMTENQMKQCIDKVVNLSQICHKKMGGIHLFNENYVRGIQSLQNKWEAIEAKKKKRYNQKQLIKELIFKEMTEQVEVQKIHQNDEISKFIKQGKIKHQLYYHIEYQKDLQSISIFLKQSQDDALKFLTQTRKVNTDAQNEDDIIINYHQLIEILAQKKKNEFDMIESKIKEIVDSFKGKVDLLDNQIQVKDADIRQLQYKLKRKQGKEIGSQTFGLRNNLNLSSTSQLESIEQQHKAIVEMLRKNIDTTQKQLLNLETDVRIKQQKIKKKDTEISVLEAEIQKYKKNLKDQKQKTLHIIRQKALPQNPNLAKEAQKLQDCQKFEQASYDNENGDEEQLSKTNQRRKNKMMGSNFSTSMISSSSKFRMGREDSLLSSGFAQNKRMSSFNSSLNSIPYTFNQTGSSNYQANQTNPFRGDDFKIIESEDVSTERQQGRNLSTIFSSDGRNATIISLGSNYEKDDEFGTMKRIDVLQNRRQSGNIYAEKYTYSQQIGQNIRQSRQGVRLSQRDTNKYGDTPKQPGIKRSSKISKKSIQSKNAPHIFDNSLSSPKDSQFKISAHSLLRKNAEALYEALFSSVISVNGQPFIPQDQINKLKEFMSRYNQRQVQTRLRRMISFLNLSQHTQQIDQKQVCQEEDTMQNSSKQLVNQNNPNRKSINRPKISSIDFSKENHKSDVRVRQAQTQADKNDKDSKLIDLQSLKQRKIKKLMPSLNFLGQLYTQIRVSGRGFNLSKQQFIDLCKTITFQQSHLNSQHSSISDSEDESNTQSVHKPAIFNKYKNKDAVITENAQKQESMHHNDGRILKIEGLSIYEKNRENGKSEHKKKKTNENLQNLYENPKSHKFSITKEIQHQIRGMIPALTSNGTTQSVFERKNQIKQFYATLKSQGAKVDSYQKFKEMMEHNKISLEDILKISNSLKSEKIQDITGLFSHSCEKSKNKTNQKSFHVEPCCLHARRYEAFLQKLSITEDSVRKMRKDLLNMHIFNIDGNEAQKDFSKKKLTKQKSYKILDITNLPSSRQAIFERPGQYDSFYVIKKKDKVKEKGLTKKGAVSAYIEAKLKTQTQMKRENERKSVGNFNLKGSMTGFLPQLTKGMSQLIRD